MMNVSTPACSHEPSRSFIQRCSVLRRTEALPGKGRLMDVLTPYSMVGARRISSAPDKSSARHSTMIDRKSTRLNSSHSQISYAVFCLKKKKKKKEKKKKQKRKI